MWAIDITTLFFMLISVIITTTDRLDDEVRIILLSYLHYWNLLSLELQSALWKEKQSKKELTNLLPE